MHYLDSSPGRTVLIGNNEYLFFSGYNYLAMGQQPTFVELVKEGIDRHGILHPSSRISNTRISIYEEMESLLAEQTRQQEAILFSSGFLSGRAIAEIIADEGLPVFKLANTHPAIQLQGEIISFENYDDLDKKVSQHDRIALLVDAVNPLAATIADLSFLQPLPKHVKIICIIDDSHGFGLLGQKGEGIISLLPVLPNVEYVLTYSLSKAIHLNGGAISCSSSWAAKIRRSSYYTASTPMSPFLCYAYLHGQQLYQQQLQKLRSIIQLFANATTDCKEKIQVHPQLPIVILPAELDEDFFATRNLIISSFPYPDPRGKLINRLVLNAAHTAEDISKVASLIKDHL